MGDNDLDSERSRRCDDGGIATDYVVKQFGTAAFLFWINQHYKLPR